jgi:hypothetical protein
MHQFCARSTMIQITIVERSYIGYAIRALITRRRSISLSVSIVTIILFGGIISKCNCESYKGSLCKQKSKSIYGYLKVLHII